MKDADTFIQWLNGSLIAPVFKAPICGNGVCEGPEEFQGFSRCVGSREQFDLTRRRFGCIADCGAVTNLQPIVVETSGILHEQTEGFGSEIGYTYNIKSDAVADYLFAENKAISGTTKRTILSLPVGAPPHVISIR